MIWDELCKLALIGTDRLAFSDDLQSAFDKIGIQPADNPAQQLLDGAAIYYNLQRAGFSLLTLEEERKNSPPSDTSLLATTSAAARFLQILLSGRFSRALPECLDCFGKAEMSLPPETLPALFEYSLKKPAFWTRVFPLLDSKAHWLLLQHPDWIRLAVQSDTSRWEVAEENERIAILRFLRLNEAEKAVTLIQSVWEGISYMQKKNLLQLLEVNPGSYDEDLLRQALNDSRKEVRSEAALLLSKLRDSDLYAQLTALGEEVLKIGEDKKGQVILPERMDKVLEQLGIDHKKSKYKGKKSAVQAYEILSRIRPSHWEEKFKKPILDILRMISNGGYAALVTQALARAAITYSDKRWVEGILRYWWRQQDEKQWSSKLGEGLIKQLPAPVFNEMIVQHFRQESGFLEEEGFIHHLILVSEHYWENRSTKLVLSRFQEWMNSASSYHWNLWHYKKIFKLAAYRANPDLLDSFSRGWNARSPVWTNWEPSIENMLKTWAFRKDMRKAFGL